MARIWTEPYGLARKRTFMPPELGGADAIRRHVAAPTLEPHRVIYVRVCSFTFEFHTLEEMRACAAFYETKLLKSGRSSEAAQAVRNGTVLRSEVERWYECLPLHLREEGKRARVVAALRKAVRKAEAGEL